MVSRSCGAPVTVAGSSKSTVAVMTSPAMKMPPARFPVPDSETPVTRGPVVSVPAPSTFRSPSLVKAYLKRLSVAAPSVSPIVPEFNPRALAAMLIPSLSVSAATTV